ncbi:alpha-mannosidase [Pedobacter sp. BAL39]|uniref:glycoside hydrolase family 38 C-terminal domain-containing protein n=1 Tax=Pedobacter sp. BAL39 TaxID=391596 RepID=UPI00015599FE|nr:glycoside hydrolase family 38 C-terminal domain-containing protein [Pedobacter sp. BAL39]EDM36970.1 alpha-mannosidase [Pedobacter sp. BAL39]
MNMKRVALVALFLLFPGLIYAQQAYFVDGYHGGIWGHYPDGYTSFIVEQLNKHPRWHINLEIEPETWDLAKKNDSKGYQAMQELLKDQSANSRVEYVNPAYGQPYMFNISGESIIRQLDYGMKHLRNHFPALNFKTYSSEEPCFTSALPQILKSFGYQYASLKNPNTCWGGYTRAYGQELVNWIGPDGTAILTSPRYAVEALKPGSTWETMASTNSKEYVTAALNDGIKNPVGMCLQDAGWYFGPWLKKDFYQPTVYTTWKNYFENITKGQKAADWKVGQEDILTSLVWGSQVLQQLAQQVRIAENKLVQAEKIAAIDQLDAHISYPSAAIDEAWRNLMLAQHHDCWIVPYNGKKGDTWADKVVVWTERTCFIADSIKNSSATRQRSNRVVYLKVYNTLGSTRRELLTTTLPDEFSANDQFMLTDDTGRELPFQLLKDGKSILFHARVPAMGYAVFKVEKGNGGRKDKATKVDKSASIAFEVNGDCIMETDNYRIHIDKAKGGTLSSLIAKGLEGKEFVDQGSERKFNELRGNFYNKGGFLSSADTSANITVLEQGPYLISIEIQTSIAGHPVSQVISMYQGAARINCHLEIDWQHNEGIGEFEEKDYQERSLHKAFYNDQYKLLTLFPLALEKQKIAKDAPFDVTESRLENTFFSTWDSIKNNILLNWVDVVSEDDLYGMAVFADHTTSYAHGADFPLGLTTQYSGKGLWGRNYTIRNATRMNYSMFPHMGTWQQGKVSMENEKIKAPLEVLITSAKPLKFNQSLISVNKGELELSSCTLKGADVYVRVFNASKGVTKGELTLNFDTEHTSFVNLDDTELNPGNIQASGAVRGSNAASGSNVGMVKTGNSRNIQISLRPFGFTTLKLTPIKETYKKKK